MISLPAPTLTLAQTWLSSLADSLAAAPDPVAADPADLMRLAGLTPDDWQADLLRSDWQRALLLCSRQSGKSTVTAALATHTAVYQPGSLTLLLSPSLRQSGELFGTVKGFYRSVPHAAPVKRESALQMQLVNGSRIVALPGKEATVRGFAGVDLLVLDEAARVPDELYFSVRPMLAVSGGRLVMLSTPWGQRGAFYNEWTGGAAWHRLKVTADQCPRISAEFLAEEKAAMGPTFYRQEYFCEFLQPDNAVFSYAAIDDAADHKLAPLFAGPYMGVIHAEQGTGQGYEFYRRS